MDCNICMEPLGPGCRQPKSLPCGHTFCLRCLENMETRTCPVDRKTFGPAPSKLPDNFALLEVCGKAMEVRVERVEVPAPSVLWCRQCDAEPSADCADDHPLSLCSQRRVGCESLRPRVDALHTGESSLEQLEKAVQAMLARPLQEEAADCVQRLQQARVALAGARQSLEQLLEAGDLEQAGELALPQSGLATSLLALLADKDSTCSLSARGGDESLSGSVRLAEDAAARLLMCRLLSAGALSRQEDEQHAGEGGEAAAAAAAKGATIASPGAAFSAPAAPRWVERSNQGLWSPQEMARWMFTGARVARGRHWRPACLDDGTPPGPGTATRRLWNGDWMVTWDSGRSGTYKMGRLDKYQLRLVREYTRRRCCAKPGPGRVILDLFDVSSSTNVMDKMANLGREKLAMTTHVQNLHCDVSPKWSKLVLERVSANVESVALLSPQAEHMEVTRIMPKLDALLLNACPEGALLPANLVELCMETVTRSQLVQIASMQSLRALEIHCRLDSPLSDVSFPRPTAPAGLRWLRTGIYPLRTALALMRANAATLEEVELVAATKEPYGCPGLGVARELQRCGFAKLESLRLVRGLNFALYMCQHDAEECKLQKLGLWNALMDGDRVVQVTCDLCY